MTDTVQTPTAIKQVTFQEIETMIEKYKPEILDYVKKNIEHMLKIKLDSYEKLAKSLFDEFVKKLKDESTDVGKFLDSKKSEIIDFIFSELKKFISTLGDPEKVQKGFELLPEVKDQLAFVFDIFTRADKKQIGKREAFGILAAISTILSALSYFLGVFYGG